MGKRIEELEGLNETPIAVGGGWTGDPHDRPWYQFIGVIDDLTTSGLYDWAVYSLNGIRETVERTKRVTEGQRRAVANIEASRGRGGPRRYEGYQRARW